MDNLRLRIRRNGEEQGLERITGWLQELIIEGSGDELIYGCELQKEKEYPVTPRQQLTLQEPYEEISPTDTSFSGGSIFDIPDRYYEPGSPCRRKRFSKDVSKTSSCDDNEDQDEGKEVSGVLDTSNIKTRFVQPKFTSIHSRSVTLDSHDPASDYDEQLEDPPTPAYLSAPHLQDLTAPRIVNIVSCLQCTLANLPCSRTTPSCTRCTRNGDPSTCLLQRRRFHEEVNRSDPGSCTSPVLLKLRDESQEVWKRKLVVAEEIYEKWIEQQDRKNWVLPRIDSERRVNWNVREFLGRKKHPGEGIGRVAYDLVADVAVDVVQERRNMEGESEMDL